MRDGGRKKAASVPRPRVWWLGRKRSAAFDDGATGGMSAGILRAHYIAAAKVRLQSFQKLKEPANRQTVCQKTDSRRL